MSPSSTTASLTYERVERGQPNTTSYRVFLKNTQNGQYVSPFHDIPLRSSSDNVFNMFVEIPRWTNAKMEINKEEKFNPVKQDIKKGKLRYVNNVFPHHGYIWNYGALPQTWEDPFVHDKCADGYKGDNDPLDACEIGSRVQERAALRQVKVLGALGLIDEGEADWKLIVIDVTDPMAELLNDIGDVELRMPGLLDATRDWFKIYKIPAGKPVNEFSQNGKFLDRAFALQLIEHAHNSWKHLMSGGYADKNHGVSQVNSTLNDKWCLPQQEAEQIVHESSKSFVSQPAELDADAVQACEQVHYLDRSKL